MTTKLTNYAGNNFRYFVSLARDTAKTLGNNLVNNTTAVAKFFIEGYNKTVESFSPEANVAISCETMNEVVSGEHLVPLPAAVAAACVGMVAIGVLETMVTKTKPTLRPSE